MISVDWETLPGRLFRDACPMAIEWLPFYIDCAKTGTGNLNESYNHDLKRFLSAYVFSPQIGQVAMMVMDRTNLWEADQALRGRDKDLALLFSAMSSGFCMGKIIRNEQGKAVDALFEMINPSFEILEGFPTATMQGKRLFALNKEDTAFARYVEVADTHKKITFTKYIPSNGFTLEIVCFSQGDDIFVCIENDISARVKAEKELKEAHETILASIDYSSKIQRNLLPRDSTFEKAFLDYSVIWKPRDIVGGDIYWMKPFETGTILVVADCTGHGTPGALLTMLVVSALEAVVNDDICHDTAEIMWRLEQRLVNVFNVNTSGREYDVNDIKDGCDLAVLFIANDGNTNLSAGHTNVYICDGKEVKRIRGQKLYIGEGKIGGKDEIKTVNIPHNPDNKFYIASDGLSDQSGWEKDEPFGYSSMGEIALANHSKPLSEITGLVWAAFEKHRGNSPRLDDFVLVAFKV